MRMTLLAQKQKRLQNWTRLLPSISDPLLKRRMEKALREFRRVLAEAWESGESARYDAEILDLERQLESLDEEVRLTVVA